MSHLVRVASNIRAVALPNGRVLIGGEECELSDVDFAKIPSELIGSTIIDVSSTGDGGSGSSLPCVQYASGAWPARPSTTGVVLWADSTGAASDPTGWTAGDIFIQATA